MRILVLGGGPFVGRAIVTALLHDSHQPTMFSRGKTGVDLFPSVPRLIGDRDTGDYAELAVVDAATQLREGPRRRHAAHSPVGHRRRRPGRSH